MRYAPIRRSWFDLALRCSSTLTASAKPEELVKSPSSFKAMSDSASPREFGIAAAGRVDQRRPVFRWTIDRRLHNFFDTRPEFRSHGAIRELLAPHPDLRHFNDRTMTDLAVKCRCMR